MEDSLRTETPYSLDTADLAQGASVSLAGRFTGRTLNLLTQISVARLFGPQDYGLYTIGLTILRLGGLLSTLGMDTAVVRYGARYQTKNRDRLSWVLLLSIGIPISIGTIAGGVLFFGAPWLANTFFDDPSLEPVIRLFALGIGPLAGLQVAAAGTRISKRMQFWVLAEELTQPALALLLILIVALMGLGILGAGVATVLSIGAALIVALYYVRRLFPEVWTKGVSPKGPWRELLLYSVIIFGSRFSIISMNWIDRLVLGSYWPAAVVGVYQAAAQSAILFAIILSSFNNIFSPLVADLWHRGEMRRLEAVYRTSTKWGVYLSLPFFAVIWFAPSLVLTAVFGQDYAGGALALKILAVGHLVHVGTGGVGLLLSISGHHRPWGLTAAAILSVDLMLLLALVPRYGMLGAAVATSGTFGALFMLGLVQVRRRLGLWPYDRRYIKGLIAGLGSFVALYWLSQMPFSQPLLGLAVLTLASVGAFGGLLLAQGLDDEDKEFMGLIRSRLNQMRGDKGE